MLIRAVFNNRSPICKLCSLNATKDAYHLIVCCRKNPKFIVPQNLFVWPPLSSKMCSNRYWVHCKNYLLTSTQKIAWFHCHNIHILFHVQVTHCLCYPHTRVLSMCQCRNHVNTTQTIVWVVHKLLCEYNSHCVDPLKWCNTTVCASFRSVFKSQLIRSSSFNFSQIYITIALTCYIYYLPTVVLSSFEKAI